MSETIPLALCSDINNLAGLLITINSIVKNCSNPECLHFYILVDTIGLVDLLETIFGRFMQKVNHTIKHFDEAASNAISGYQNFCNDNKHCRNLMNFSRFFLPSVFTEPEFMVYIDTDFLVVDDICNLWAHIDKKSEFYAIPSEYTNEMAYSLTKDSTVELSKRPPFNAGIYVMNCKAWRENAYVFEFIEMINDPVLQKSFRFGTQPLLNYKFQETYILLPTRWNRVAYDYVREIENRPISLFNNLSNEELVSHGVSALHFAGTPKPWFISQVATSGNWPSPRDLYRGYLPYKNTVFLSKQVPERNNKVFKKLKEMYEDIFGVNLLVAENNESEKTRDYLLLHIQDSSDSEDTDICFGIIQENIVPLKGINDMNTLQKIVEVSGIKEDGLYNFDQERGTIQKSPLFQNQKDAIFSNIANYVLIYKLLGE